MPLPSPRGGHRTRRRILTAALRLFSRNGFHGTSIRGLARSVGLTEAAIWELTMKVALDQQFISSAVCAARFVASAHPESPIPGVAAGILAHGSVTGSPRPAAEMIYGAYELMQRERLLQIPFCAIAKGLVRHRRPAECGDENDGDLGDAAVEDLEQVEAIHAG